MTLYSGFVTLHMYIGEVNKTFDLTFYEKMLASYLPKRMLPNMTEPKKKNKMLCTLEWKESPCPLAREI